VVFFSVVLSAKKPLSIFGVFDEPWKESLRDEWKAKIKEHKSNINIEEPKSNNTNVNGPLDENDLIMIKLLREKLVDLGPLEDVSR